MCEKQGRLAFGGLVRSGTEHTARLLLRQRKETIVERGLDIGQATACRRRNRIFGNRRAQERKSN